MDAKARSDIRCKLKIMKHAEESDNITYESHDFG